MNQDFNSTPSDEDLESVVQNLKGRNFDAIVVQNASEALEKLKAMIPQGSEMHTASSTTLKEIGFMDYVQGDEHEWDYLGKKLYEEKDPVKQGAMRRRFLAADYFVGGINAISKDGILVLSDRSGSRISAYAHAAGHVIIVSGINKIVENKDEGMKRIKEYVLPLESERAMKAYGVTSNTSKWMIWEREENVDRVKMILIKEKLGF